MVLDTSPPHFKGGTQKSEKRGKLKKSYILGEPKFESELNF